MKKITLGAALAASMAMPAQATVVLDFGSNNNLKSGNNYQANQIEGTQGNTRTYTGVDNGNPFTVKATAWTISYNPSNVGNSVVTNSFLGVYTNGTSAYDGGFGVTNDWENGRNNTHTIDNGGTNTSNGRKTFDFIVLQFDRQVSLTGAYFDSYGDTDATIRYGNMAGAPSWNGVNYSNVTNALGGLVTINNSSNSGDGYQGIVGSNVTANTWMISSLFPTTSVNDSFKLSAIKVTVPPAVPEPGTWALMILGFGAIGAGMRRRKQQADTEALRLA